jgi:hypothetical protein
VLGAPRSSVYARRAQAGAGGRPGPATSISDDDLLKLIRLVLRASPFAGEGYCKVRARLRREHGVGVSGKSQVAVRGVTGDRRHGLSAQDAVSWATSWVPVVEDRSGWSVAITRAMEDSDR